MGGQTALNLCIECDEIGMWEKHNVKITSREEVERAGMRRLESKRRVEEVRGEEFLLYSWGDYF